MEAFPLLMLPHRWSRALVVYDIIKAFPLLMLNAHWSRALVCYARTKSIPTSHVLTYVVWERLLFFLHHSKHSHFSCAPYVIESACCLWHNRYIPTSHLHAMWSRALVVRTFNEHIIIFLPCITLCILVMTVTHHQHTHIHIKKLVYAYQSIHIKKFATHTLYPHNTKAKFMSIASDIFVFPCMYVLSLSTHITQHNTFDHNWSILPAVHTLLELKD